MTSVLVTMGRVALKLRIIVQSHSACKEGNRWRELDVTSRAERLQTDLRVAAVMGKRILAVVEDLFFIAKIKEAAAQAGARLS